MPVAYAGWLPALLVNGPRSQAFRTAVTELFGGDDSEFKRPTKRQPIECLTITQRYQLLDLIERVMRDFPSRFISVCQKARMWRSRVIKDMVYVPFRVG